MLRVSYHCFLWSSLFGRVFRVVGCIVSYCLQYKELNGFNTEISFIYRNDVINKILLRIFLFGKYLNTFLLL